MNRNRIIRPRGAIGPEPSAEDIRMMTTQNLVTWWANYAELVKLSDLEDKEQIAAAAHSKAAEHLKIVIDAAEKKLEEMG